MFEKKLFAPKLILNIKNFCAFTYMKWKSYPKTAKRYTSLI